ncbi:ribonuclease T2 family protein [Roseisalinus antarcticus]|uniref:Ribonuclease T2 family protein n=1 Tax=Roseisalinus antarcticus TaxID=254357 RepID=A0A1Y5RTF1_9RHOB|nr:ribonuclease T2 [Roseisalinus antarcticus]SLN22365.1 Ribonuclease T2 family protein [Roseisalinus antarcticus]
MLRLTALLMILALPGRADDVAGEFDYYVLSLSWSANWCALEGDSRGSPQCDPARDHGWVLHGLWPQYETGWPSDCRSTERNPTRAMTEAMADVMGTSGLAWHQWEKHGRCTGLSAEGYYDLSRTAYDRVTRPEVFRRLTRPVELPAEVVEEAFLRDNPGLVRDAITITCRSGQIQEARLCLTRDLEFRRCGADVIRDCTLDDALLHPMR